MKGRKGEKESLLLRGLLSFSSTSIISCSRTYSSIGTSITTGPNVCLSVLHQRILLVQIHLTHFGGEYKTQAHTTSKRLPFCFRDQISEFIITFFTYSAFLFILIENKEKEGFTAPTPSRLGLLS